MQELKKHIKADMLAGVPVSEDKMKKLDQLRKAIIIRAWKEGAAEAHTIKVLDKSEETINSLRGNIKNHFKVEEKDENWRLRRYNKTFDQMYEVYDSAETTLEQLDFGEEINVIVESKKDEEVFEPYDPRKIVVKVCAWQPDVMMITDRKSKSIKIPILE